VSCLLDGCDVLNLAHCIAFTGCGHCKSLVPQYSELGQQVAADTKLKNRVLIAKVDADAHRELGEQQQPAYVSLCSWFTTWKPARCGNRAPSLEALLPASPNSSPNSPFTGEKFGVRGFPTIKWFPRGKASAPEE
jgi:thiol-disulfide isomerase/thioredoxin